jgi:hypothetical protein
MKILPTCSDLKLSFIIWYPTNLLHSGLLFFKLCFNDYNCYTYLKSRIKNEIRNRKDRICFGYTQIASKDFKSEIYLSWKNLRALKNCRNPILSIT